MPTQLALLRGLNVAGRRPMAMPTLRALVSSLGYTDVRTYLQSGNVLFSNPDPDPASAAQALQRALGQAFEVLPPVVVLTRAELAQVVADNPYRAEPDPRQVHVVLWPRQPGAELPELVARAQRRATERGGQDEGMVVGRALFVHTRRGLGRSQLAALLAREPLWRVATARNWATVLALLRLCDEAAAG